MTGVFAGSTAACSSALAPLLSAVGAAPTSRFVGPENYLQAMLIEAGCESLTVAQCHVPTRNRWRNVVPLGLHGEVLLRE